MVGQLFQSNSKHLLVFILFLNCNSHDEFKILFITYGLFFFPGKAHLFWMVF